MEAYQANLKRGSIPRVSHNQVMAQRGPQHNRTGCQQRAVNFDYYQDYIITAKTKEDLEAVRRGIHTDRAYLGVMNANRLRANLVRKYKGLKS